MCACSYHSAHVEVRRRNSGCQALNKCHYQLSHLVSAMYCFFVALDLGKLFMVSPRINPVSQVRTMRILKVSHSSCKKSHRICWNMAAGNGNQWLLEDRNSVPFLGKEPGPHDSGNPKPLQCSSLGLSKVKYREPLRPKRLKT